MTKADLIMCGTGLNLPNVVYTAYSDLIKFTILRMKFGYPKFTWIKTDTEGFHVVIPPSAS